MEETEGRAKGGNLAMKVKIDSVIVYGFIVLNVLAVVSLIVIDVRHSQRCSTCPDCEFWRRRRLREAA